MLLQWFDICTFLVVSRAISVCLIDFFCYKVLYLGREERKVLQRSVLFIIPASRDPTRRHLAVRDSKDGDGRDDAPPPHLCVFGRFPRFIKLIKHGELRWTGAAYSVDKRGVSNVEFGYFFPLIIQAAPPVSGCLTLFFSDVSSFG